MKKIYFIFLLVLFFIVSATNSKAQWTRINFTDTLYQEPLRTRYIVECNNELFAMVDGIGLYRSSNEGISWDQLNNINTNIRKVYSGNNTLFYDTWDYKFFRSTDNGNTWNSIDNSFLIFPVLPPPNDLTQYMVINSLTANSYYIFIGTGAGIFRSGDNGITWTSCSTGLPNDYYNVHFIEVTSLLILDQYLFAGTIYQGVYLSTNNGEKWESTSEGLPRWRI